MSRRLSGRGKEDRVSKTQQKRKAPVTLQDVPMPVSKVMTTANLFQPMQSTSTQATDMDRTLYEIPQPNNVDEMTDLIKEHQSGDFFPYVGVVGSEGESPDARRARMLALKPSYNKRDIPEIKVLGCPLISQEGDFTMKSLMSYAKVNSEAVPVSSTPMPSGVNPDYSITKPYVHIRQVTVLFTPNVSSTSNYCKFWMNLIDNRLIDPDKGSQTNVIASNQDGIMEMSCDYCVSTKDLEHFTLTYTMERNIVHPGFQWGTASFYFSITESDLPYQSSKVDAMAVYRMPITTLMDRKTNADKSNIFFTPADLVKLRDLYSAGDIVDVDEPQRERLKTNLYSKSSIRTKPKGEKISVEGKPGWEFMASAVKPKIDAYAASVDPSDDSSVAEPVTDTQFAAEQRKISLDRYRKQQEEERLGFQSSSPRTSSPNEYTEKIVMSSSPEPDDEEFDTFFKKDKSKKKVQIAVSGV